MYARNARATPSSSAMERELGEPASTEAVSGIFSIGLFAMLLVPLILAAGTAWCCLRNKRDSSELQAVPDETDCEEALRPAGVSALSRQRSSASMTPVHFRKPPDWRSAMQPRRALITRVELDGVHSLPELHTVLRRAHRHVTEQQSDGSSAARLTPKESKHLAFAVEYRDASAKMVQVTAATDLKVLSAVKALYVSVSSRAPKREATTAAAAVAAAAAAATVAVEEEEAPDCDEEESDTASAISMVDLSLAGCCGVKSTCGGLAVTSDYVAQPARRKQRRKLQAAAAKPRPIGL